MAPKMVVSKQDILNALCQFDIFVNRNERKLKHRNNSVWQNVCDVLKNNIKPSTLNLKVKFNKNGLLDDLLMLKSNTEPSPKEIGNKSVNSTSFNNASVDIPMSSSFDMDIDALNYSEFREEQMLHEQVQINVEATVESDNRRNVANSSLFPNSPITPLDTSATSSSTGSCLFAGIQLHVDDIAENAFCTFILPASFLHKYWVPKHHGLNQDRPMK